ALEREPRDARALAEQHRVGQHGHGLGALFLEGGEGAVDLVGPGDVEGQQGQAQSLGGRSGLLQLQYVGGIRRVGQHGHAAEPGDGLLGNSRYFPERSGPAERERPVMFPPGRARLATTPSSTGVQAATTMGTSLVAFLAAWMPGVVNAKTTST